MKNDTTIIRLRQLETIDDPLSDLAREGARRMLAEALNAEVDDFLTGLADERLPDGRRRVVRHGFGPERSIQTGIGAIDVRRPKVRDRATDVPADEKARFTSNILPKWARCSLLNYGHYGLVLCFLHQSVMIEPVHARTFLAGTGGGWIVLGLVNEDRF